MTTVEERAEARTAALNRLRRRVDSGLIVDRSSTDAGRNDRFEFVMDVITVSGAADIVGDKRGTDKARSGKGPGGRKAKVTDVAVLVLMHMVQLQFQPSEIKEMADELLALSDEQRHRLGLGDDFTKDNAYGRVWSAFHRYLNVVDPFPITPELGGDRRTQMAKAQFEQVKKNRDPEERERNLKVLYEIGNKLVQVAWHIAPKQVRQQPVTLSVDGTSYPCFGQNPPAKGHLLAPSEPDAAWHGRSGDHRGDNGGDVDFFGFEGHFAVSADVDPKHPMPPMVLGFALDKPGFRISENSLDAIDAALRLGITPGDVIADRGILPKAKVEDLQLPLRARGFGLCFDYQRDQLGIQAEAHGAILVEGTWYCPQMPTELIDASIDYQADRIDDSTYEARIHQRRRYEMRYKQLPDSAGAWRFICSAEEPNRRAWCPIKPGATKDRAGKTHITVVPETPGDVCTKHSVTFFADEGAKYMQKLPYMTPEWKTLYGKRNIVESTNGHFKDPSKEDGAQGRRRRVRGFAAQFLFLTGLLVSANIRKLQTFVDEASADPPTRKRVGRRRKEALLSTYRATEAEPVANGPPVAA